MRAHFAVAVAVVAALLACSHPHSAPPPAPAPAVIHLDNGLTLSLRPDPNLAVANVRMIVHTGWADDPADSTGMASLVVELMHEASAAAGERSLGDRIGEISLWNDGDVGADQTGFAAIVLPEHVADALAIDAARASLDCAAIDPAALKRAAAAASTYASAPGRPDSNAAIAAFAAGTFGADHPYARDQSALTIADTTPEDVCRYLDASWGADRLELIISGNFDRENVERAVRQWFTSARIAHGPRTVPSPAWTADRDELVADIGETAIVVSLPAPEDTNDAALAGSFLASAAYGLVGRFGITKTTAGPIGTGATARIAVAASLSDTRELDAAIDALYDAMPRAIAKNAVMVAREQAKPDHGTADTPALDDFWTTTGMDVFAQFDFKATYVSAGQWMASHLSRTQAHVTVLRPSGATNAPTIGPQFPGALTLTTRRHRPAHLEAPHHPVIAGNVRTLHGMRVALIVRSGAKGAFATLAFPIGIRDYAGAELAAMKMAVHGFEDHVFGDANDRITGFTTTERDPETLVSNLYAFVHDGRATPPKRPPHHEAKSDGDEDVALRHLRCTLLRTTAFTEARGDILRALRDGDTRRVHLTWEHYQPRNATLAIVGNFDPQQMMHLVVSRLAVGHGAALPTPERRTVSVPLSWIGMEATDGQPSSYAIAFPAGSDPLADRAARLVLSHLISERGGGVLHDFPDLEESTITIGSFVETASVAKIQTALAQLEVARSDPEQLADKLAEAKQAALLDLFEYVGRPSTASGAAADVVASGLGLDYYDQVAKQIIDLAPGELARVARLDLDPAHMSVAVRGSRADVEAILVAAGATPDTIQWKAVPSCP